MNAKNVIAWLKYRRDEEARSGGDEIAHATLNGLLDEARKSYRTGQPLPTSTDDED